MLADAMTDAVLDAAVAAHTDDGDLWEAPVTLGEEGTPATASGMWDGDRIYLEFVGAGPVVMSRDDLSAACIAWIEAQAATALGVQA